MTNQQLNTLLEQIAKLIENKAKTPQEAARYLSCDTQQIQAIKNYAISVGSPVIVDRSEG